MGRYPLFSLGSNARERCVERRARRKEIQHPPVLIALMISPSKGLSEECLQDLTPVSNTVGLVKGTTVAGSIWGVPVLIFDSQLSTLRYNAEIGQDQLIRGQVNVGLLFSVLGTPALFSDLVASDWSYNKDQPELPLCVRHTHTHTHFSFGSCSGRDCFQLTSLGTIRSHSPFLPLDVLMQQ